MWVLLRKCAWFCQRSSLRSIKHVWMPPRRQNLLLDKKTENQLAVSLTLQCIGTDRNAHLAPLGLASTVGGPSHWLPAQYFTVRRNVPAQVSTLLTVADVSYGSKPAIHFSGSLLTIM